jgi:hypothetical protein
MSRSAQRLQLNVSEKPEVAPASARIKQNGTILCLTMVKTFRESRWPTQQETERNFYDAFVEFAGKSMQLKERWAATMSVPICYSRLQRVAEL